jgi:arsenate reductase
MKNQLSNAIIYHNPRCSKSRLSLALLIEHGYQPKVIEYLSTPPSVSEIKKILKLLNMKPRQLMRTKEKEYVLLGLDNSKLSDAALITAMHDHPILIERPIVIIDHQARIGRPPEAILDIL